MRNGTKQEGRVIASSSTACLMARDAGLPLVDNQSDTTCGKAVTLKLDLLAFRTGLREAQQQPAEMLSPTPTRSDDCQKQADMSSVPIIKVREQLRGVVDGNDSYSPLCVPIGPYHLSRSSPWVEKTKRLATDFLQSLSEDQHTEGGLTLTGVMEKLEPLARVWYTSGDVFDDMTPQQSSRMLLHDACYLLLFFVDYVSRNHAPPADPADDDERTANRNTLVRDTVFLLENQIPFFLLQGIHEHVTGGTTSVLDLIAKPIQELLRLQLFISRKAPPPPPTCSHLLHLVHAYFRPTLLPNESTAMGGTVTGRWRRAAEYRRYGNVRFMRRDLDDSVESSVLDVQLERGTLWIPCLRVDSNTWTILRNLMALEEQAHYRRPVTAYCLFMSQLACTAQDVQLLRRAGIVDHFMGNDEQVSNALGCLCKGVVTDMEDLDKNYLKPMWHQLEKRCAGRPQRLMGWLHHGQSWEITAAFFLAVILIACQVTQTFYAVAGGGGGH